MKVLVIPTTDWIRHPVPNRLNFIFDILAEENEIYVLHFDLKKFRNLKARKTMCTLVQADLFPMKDPSLHYLANSPFHLARIRKTVREKKIDVILSANVLPSFCSNFAGVPVVFDYLDHLEESAAVYYPGNPVAGIVQRGVRLITRYNLRHACSVITVTEELARYLAGVGTKKVTVIPNGVDTTVLSPLPKDRSKAALNLSGPVIGYVGSLEHWVDLETVVVALPHLDATLLVIGPGLFTDYGEKIKNMADEYGVSDRVIFTGMIPYQELAPYISAMDIGLNPLKKMKKNEYAAGGKVFNYLACGRPVLSSRTLSLEALFGDLIGYYDDADTFVTRVKEMLQEQWDEAELRKIAESYDWKTLAGRYGQVLEEAI